jgi:6-phosphofructokinase 1
VDRSFGFNTAVGHAVRAIESIAVEAKCAPNGVGIVQLMGRHAGFIAAYSTLATDDVDLCLIPEVPFELDGPNGIFDHIQNVTKRQGYCVIVVAEGAGANILEKFETITDEGGNKKKSVSIGPFLKSAIADHFKSVGVAAAVKFNDPAYMIRSTCAAAEDRIYCLSLAQNAVHGAMAGLTNFSSGLVNNRSVYIPIEVITSSSPSYLNPRGRTWERVVSTTHQPDFSATQRNRRLLDVVDPDAPTKEMEPAEPEPPITSRL